jgi:hypothetical protein
MAIAMVSKQEAAPKDRKHRDGTPIAGLEYIKATGKGDIDPQGFTAFVENETLRAHFHDVDQFQVMFGVPGSFYQRTPVPEVMIHYADAFVTYGPLIGEEPALRYFTLRARPSTGMWFMPEEREHLAYRGKRRLEVFPEPYSDQEPLADGTIEEKVVMEDERDGLEAKIVIAGPGATVVVDPSLAATGQYTVVVNGSVEHDGKTYGPESIGWQTQNDGPSELKAGSSGARVIVVRFPYPATTVSHK